MRKITLFLSLGLILLIGCASVQVKAPKEPIKVDISMRLDVYQHVQNDIDAIEDIVKDTNGNTSNPGDQGMLNFLISTAYAQDLPAEVEGAALRRKARYRELKALEQAGVIGENNMGLIEARKTGDASTGRLISDENADRMLIYKEIASKNGTSVGNVQKLYAERLRNDAPPGTPVQAEAGQWGVK